MDLVANGTPFLLGEIAQRKYASQKAVNAPQNLLNAMQICKAHEKACIGDQGRVNVQACSTPQVSDGYEDQMARARDMSKHDICKASLLIGKSSDEAILTKKDGTWHIYLKFGPSLIRHVTDRGNPKTYLKLEMAYEYVMDTFSPKTISIQNM